MISKSSFTVTVAQGIRDGQDNIEFGGKNTGLLACFDDETYNTILLNHLHEVTVLGN